MFTKFPQIIQIPNWGRALFVAMLAVTIAATADAAPWTETFEGPDIKLQNGGGDAQYQFRKIAPVASSQHGGKQCAYLQVVGQGGSYVYATLDIGRPRIIPELYPTIWVQSDRPGIRLFARAVLPKTIDPKTGRPITVLLAGTRSTATGKWQMLEISDLPKLLKQQIHVTRTQAPFRVDGTGAYIDQLVLNVYGGPGTTNVLVDDATIYGYVAMPVAQAGGATAQVVDDSNQWSGATATTGRGSFVGAGRTVPPAGPIGGNYTNAVSHPVRRVEMKGSELYVDDNPILVRAVRYHGESLTTLKELGFNAIWLDEEPSADLLAEAQAIDLYIIGAPPKAVQVDISPTSTVPVPKIGPEYNQVLAWNLGHGLLESHIEQVRTLSRQIRAADDRQNRPLVCCPETNLRDFSNCRCILLVGRSPLGTSLELSDYGTWIRERPRLARPGTTVWSTIQTEVSKELYDQWRLSGQGISPPPILSAEQIRLTAYTAIAAGSRGLLFESRSSLEKTDFETQARATSLALLNMELELVRPWVAAGTLLDTVSGDQPDTAGAVFTYTRSKLLVPMWVGPGAQLVPGQSAGNTISFTVPPVPESSRVYEITPGTLRPVKSHDRVTGGVEVTLNEFSLSTFILFTEDRKTIASMSRRAKAIGEKAARLYRRLAEQKLHIVQEVNRLMAGYPKSIWDVGDHLIESRKRLQECDGAIAAGNWTKACIAADRAMRPLRMIERTNWSRAVGSLRSPVASPATICFSTLPWHWSLANQARTWQRSGNQLLGGDFEQLEQVCNAGWTNFRHPNSGVDTQVDITPLSAHSGMGGIRLRAAPKDPDAKPTLVETPPAWIRSPTIHVAAGSIVRIEGWVQIPTPITGSVDGLLIFDSMTGESMAERIGETTSWQPFVLYRVATKTGPMNVTLALAGMGEVWIDDLMIQTLTANPIAGRPAGAVAR